MCKLKISEYSGCGHYYGEFGELCKKVSTDITAWATCRMGFPDTHWPYLKPEGKCSMCVNAKVYYDREGDVDPDVVLLLAIQKGGWRHIVAKKPPEPKVLNKKAWVWVQLDVKKRNDFKEVLRAGPELIDTSLQAWAQASDTDEPDEDEELQFPSSLSADTRKGKGKSKARPSTIAIRKQSWAKSLMYDRKFDSAFVTRAAPPSSNWDLTEPISQPNSPSSPSSPSSPTSPPLPSSPSKLRHKVLPETLNDEGKSIEHLMAQAMAEEIKLPSHAPSAQPTSQRGLYQREVPVLSSVPQSSQYNISHTERPTHSYDIVSEFDEDYE